MRVDTVVGGRGGTSVGREAPGWLRRSAMVGALVVLIATLGLVQSVMQASPGVASPATAVPVADPAPPRPVIVNAFMNNATAPKYRQDMQAYSLRHYWMNTAVLKPQAVVLHYTVSGAGSWRGVVNGWDVANAVGSNTGGENPQPAAHFVIEQDGTIYQTMPTNLMVRHAYGLNYAAIGIEFIEWSSASNVLARRAQAEAGLALVRWLMYEHGIPAANILGHGTANYSPLFVDVTGARNDHTDWNAAEVNAFRSRLGAVPAKPRALIGAIAQRYQEAGLAWPLGAPTSDEMDAWTAGARVQNFVRGQMLWSPATGAHEVYGSIGLAYRLKLAELSPMGLPTSGERAGPFAGSRMNSFQNGAIIWSPVTGAHDVYGAIYLRYATLSRENLAGLGLPTSGERNGPTPGSRMNSFQHGAIIWSPSTGAQDVYGGIFSRYATLSRENLAGLGLPTSGERAGPFPGSRMNSFRSGAIIWSPSTGAHDVYGAIYLRYATLSRENLAGLGLPTSGERAGPFPGSRMNSFRSGAIIWSPSTGAQDIYGAIYGRYVGLSAADQARLGLPVTGEYSVTGGRESRFQRGTITWNATTGDVVVRYL